jgi:ABC-type nitrate/sulfonate/bicarbonate transport system substrate-binding protein
MQTEQAGQFASAAGDWKQVMQLLRGKKIGVTVRGGSPDLNLRFMLTQAGLTPDKDVTIVPLSNGAGELGALKAKQVDGILTFTPVTQQIELDKQGTAVLNLAKAGQAPAELDQPFVMAAMSQTFIKDHPDTVRAFVAAMTDTMAFIKDPSKRDQVVGYIQKEIKDIRTDVAQQVAAELAETVDPSVPDSLTDKINTVLKVNGVLKNPVGASDLIAKL